MQPHIAQTIADVRVKIDALNLLVVQLTALDADDAPAAASPAPTATASPKPEKRAQQQRLAKPVAAGIGR
ncbi:MAG TPA: hypothetical protein VHB20_14490, partial [Verrucomicrobiae bacterium]|nr:hypothetical protein [Verrucomicrobiae bacterium]